MADISKVQLPDGTEYNFKDDTSGYIKSPNVPYFTCATSAGTTAKVATLVSGTFTSADLVTGAQILVKFTNSNTVASPTLNANSTGAKSIKRYGTTAPSTSAATSWNAGNVFLFVYDGSYWMMADWINTSYSAMTTTEIAAGTGTSSRVITPTNLKLAIQTWAQVKSVNEQTGNVTLTASDVSAVDTSAVGAANGVAPLNASGKIDSSYLPPGSASVSDVQVNGTSVVSNDVANIPLADASTVGVVSTAAQTFAGEKTFNDPITVKADAMLQMLPGTETDAVGYAIKDFGGTRAGDMIMTVTAINGNKYPRRFRWRQYGIVASTAERQTYCETYSLPTGPLDLSANANYDIVTTKPVTPAETYAANVLGNLGIHKFSMSAAKAVTVPANYRGVLYVMDSAGGNCGEYFIISSSTGATGYTAVKTASNFTLTNGTGSITLTPASGTRYCMLLDINGFTTV